MAQPNNPVCEVKVADGWRAIAVPEANARHTRAPKRCPACYGQVTISGHYGGRTSFRLVHRKTHDGCPLIPARYAGVPTPHPRALA
jgi:hypothetical protein